MATGRFVSYLRVSTDKQGRSGLGLEAQQAAVRDYLNDGAWTLLREFVEVESGKNNDRPELARALNLCQLTGATLVVAKLDRLGRDAATILAMLRDGRVKFVCADMPDANELTVGILAVVAQAEARAISARTKAALAAAKARGTVLGGFRGAPPPPAAVASEARRAAADAFAARVLPTINAMRAEGMSLNAIAGKLDADGIQTARGGKWTATAVRNALARA